MQIILIKDVDNLGAAHELVDVRPGYARNFLIPQKFAIEASLSNKKQLEEKQKQAQKKEEKLLSEIAKVAEVLKAAPLKLVTKVGESGRIYGSITGIQIARAIREQKGYEIDRRRITFTDDIKEPGAYKASIDFGKERIVEVDFNVVADN